MTAAIIVASLLALLSLPLLLRWQRIRTRKRWMSESLPESWAAILERDFPRIRDLPEDLKPTLLGYTRILAEEKNFEACGGLKEVTGEMKALICAQAALPILALPKHGFYPKLKSILVYPGAFRDRGHRRFDLPDEDRGVLLGESWHSGSVVLSWDNVRAGARNEDDGMNVVIHEFAHQLDQVDGAADGVPILGSRDAYRHWAEVFERNYEEHVEEVNHRRGPEPLLDPYGATNPAEFFAVASETFFEESLDLKEEHPDLYAQLQDFYGLDPASWDRS